MRPDYFESSVTCVDERLPLYTRIDYEFLVTWVVAVGGCLAFWWWVLG